jgi:hypothetical protein
MKKIIYIIIAFYFFVTPVFSQSVNNGERRNALTLQQKGPYFFQRDDSSLKNTVRSNEKKDGIYKLAGYTYEVGRPDMHQVSEVILSFDTPETISYLSLNAEDTMDVMNYVMPADYDYKYEQVLSLVNPGGFNGYFLRDQGGNFYGSFLSVESKQKIEGKWRMSGYTKALTQVPYGVEYASRYFLENVCPNAWEYKTVGELKEGDWLRTMDITEKDCNTLEPKQYWREMHRFNAKGQKVEWSSYTKQGNDYTLEFKFTYAYDDQGRETERITEGDYPNPEIKKKTTQSYDEKGNYIFSKFELIGGSWVQTTKTIAERTIEGDYLYTFQGLTNSTWENRWREKYSYDVEGRLTYYEYDQWDSQQQLWNINSYDKMKYLSGNLISEGEYYNKDGDVGGKWVSTYDENNLLKITETSQCGNYADCSNGIYTPIYKAYYENRNNDDLDYFNSYRYTGDQWVRFDSVANKYNDRGEIQECFWRMYEGNFPEKIDLQQRHTYHYEEFLVTETERTEEKNIFYPNPSSGKIFVKIEENDFGSITIHDMNSHDVKINLEHLKDNIYTTDLSELSPGFYIISVKKGKQVTTQKLVKH